MRFSVAIVVAVLAAAGLAASGEKSAARVAQPVIKIERGETCVAATEEMRRDHMKMLLTQRDKTLRHGLRETRFSLKGCVECHASQQTGSVVGQEGFCSSCHVYAAVKMDCFECHTPLRQSQIAGASR